MKFKAWRADKVELQNTMSGVKMSLFSPVSLIYLIKFLFELKF